MGGGCVDAWMRGCLDVFGQVARAVDATPDCRMSREVVFGASP